MGVLSKSYEVKKRKAMRWASSLKGRRLNLHRLKELLTPLSKLINGKNGVAIVWYLRDPIQVVYLLL